MIHHPKVNDSSTSESTMVTSHHESHCTPTNTGSSLVQMFMNSASHSGKIEYATSLTITSGITVTIQPHSLVVPRLELPQESFSWQTFWNLYNT